MKNPTKMLLAASALAVTVGGPFAYRKFFSDSEDLPDSSDLDPDMDGTPTASKSSVSSGETILSEDLLYLEWPSKCNFKNRKTGESELHDLTEFNLQPGWYHFKQFSRPESFDSGGLYGAESLPFPVDELRTKANVTDSLAKLLLKEDLEADYGWLLVLECYISGMFSPRHSPAPDFAWGPVVVDESNV